jgi:hypothetical protein
MFRLVVTTIRSIPHSWLISWFVTRVAQRVVPLVEQELLTLLSNNNKIWLETILTRSEHYKIGTIEMAKVLNSKFGDRYKSLKVLLAEETEVHGESLSQVTASLYLLLLYTYYTMSAHVLGC